MRQHFFIACFMSLFVQKAVSYNGGFSAVTNAIKFEIAGGKPATVTNENVSITLTYLTNVDGHRYGAVFYVHNRNNFTVGVKWWFEGSSNVNFSPERSGTVILPANTTGVLLTTCTQADYYKAWNSGTPWFKWDPAFKDVTIK
jgi:hypothetical protein